MDQTGNLKRNLKILQNEWEWKHNISKFMRHSYKSAEREIYNTKCTLRKEEKSQINDGSSYIKNLEKEKKINPKQEGSK